MTLARRGVTLVELLVVLAVTGIILALAAAAPRPSMRTAPGMLRDEVRQARARALRTGTSVTISITIGGHAQSLTALPDGSVLADSLIPVERLSGRSADAR